jgi:hypothetical protein
MRIPRSVLAVAALALAALVATLLFLEFDMPALGRAALARLGTAVGARVDARAFRFRLVRGLALEGLTASSDLAGGQWTLSTEALVLDHRLLPLLRGRVEIERIILRRPHLRLEPTGPSARSTPARAAAALPGAAALALRVVEARMDDGTVEVVTPGQPPLTIAKLDFTMRDLAVSGATLSGLTASGHASADAIRFARSEATKVEAEFKVESGGLIADPVRFRTKEGRFQAKLRARLDRLPLTYSLDLSGDPIDLNAMAGLGQDGTLGPARVRLTAEGSGSGAASLRGQGTLHMEPGRLPPSPLLQRVQAVLTTPLVGARYQASDTPFRLYNGRVDFDSFRFRADRFSLDMRGWLALDGPLSLTASARAPRDQVRVAGVPASVLDTLVDPEGYVVVRLIVTGTQRDPVVRPDVGALMAEAGHGAGAAAARKVGEGILGLFRRRKQ